MNIPETAAPALPALAAHETIIEPNQAWLRLDGRQIWEYRDLLLLFVHREFASKYKQTILGPAWFILQPLLTSLVYTVFFGNVAHISTDGMPPLLFYLSNQLGWGYLAQNISTGGTTFTANSALFGKVYFPRLVMPLSTILSNLFACVLQLALFLAVLIGYKVFEPQIPGLHASPLLLFTPVLFLMTAALSLGVCLWFSSLSAKYRDLAQVLQLFVQIWMIASPVIYPLSSFPAKWRWIAELNPMTAILEAFRICLVGKGTLTPASMASSLAGTFLILVTGVLLFQRTERTFIDTV